MRLREALKQNDQQAATEEKLFVEDAQRQLARERKARMEEWIPKYFVRDEMIGQWIYKYSEYVNKITLFIGDIARL